MIPREKLKITVDRPLGSFHPDHEGLYYPVNYGYAEGIIAPDGEEQDVYILGVNEPLEVFEGRIIAVIKRKNDVEDKWVTAPDVARLTADEIREAVWFQEGFFESEIIMLEEKMTIPEIFEKMIVFSAGNHHDINHLIKVWGYAKTIGELEGLDSETQYILEAAALTHDIACPLCRQKYGNTDGKLQEKEGAPLVTEFLADTGMTTEEIARIAYLVGHHHTLHGIEGMDYQILIEADYLVNADESGYSKENIRNFVEKIMKTKAGIRLAKEIYGV